MSAHPQPDGLAAGYEALRAEAVGSLPSEAPRGRALVLGQGLPAWIGAWAAPAAAAPSSCAPCPGAIAGPTAEVVALLAEMALGARPAPVGLS
ncbi:MAG TPA: hypothetical protein VM390_06385 [Acidimicrobiales bacterium]|jgi:hypothetical protein|nr:hypothetical protein [Acidimicrobiales bacterium]